MLELLIACQRRGIISRFQDILEDELRAAVCSKPRSVCSWSPLALVGNLLSIEIFWKKFRKDLKGQLFHSSLFSEEEV